MKSMVQGWFRPAADGDPLPLEDKSRTGEGCGATHSWPRTSGRTLSTRTRRQGRRMTGGGGGLPESLAARGHLVVWKLDRLAGICGTWSISSMT